ncbi:hypothetical protein [Lysobacter gummosus]
MGPLREEFLGSVKKTAASILKCQQVEQKIISAEHFGQFSRQAAFQ